MRFFKSHPALAALIALAVIALAAPIAYAVVRDVWVSIDPDKPASEIEKDVNSQLEAAGVQGTVHAEKTDDGKLKLSIQQVGSNADDLGSALHISVAGRPADEVQRMVRLENGCVLDEAQQQQLVDVVSGPDMIAVLQKQYASDDELRSAIAAVLAAHGFHSAEISSDAEGIHVKVTAPPT